MTPVFVLINIHKGNFHRTRGEAGVGHWWEASLTLDGKVIAELTMPGHALTHGDALADAKRIAEINRWEFQDGTKELNHV